jgi:large subunit ribosomal protein L3
MTGILGKKIGMTTYFAENGDAVPCTVVEAGPCYVTQVKTIKKDGYKAVQLGFGSRREKTVKNPQRTIYKKLQISPARFVMEIRDFYKEDVKQGEQINVDMFNEGDSVKVSGTSKGKGFQGVIKRHGFAGGVRTHGQSDRERAPGSIGQSSYPSRVLKGMKMAGRMGGKRVSVQNLKVVKIIPDSNLMLIKGAIPGANSGFVEIYKN